MRLAARLFTIAITIGLIGCDRSDPPAVPKVAVAAGTATLAGTVTFDGVAPPPARIVEADAAKCHPSAKPVFDDSLVVDAGGGLRNVVVYLVDGPNVPSATATPVVLDQSSCQYSPHVLSVRAGQAMSIRSSDPIQHNVHALRPAANKAFSLPFTSAGQERAVTFAKPEADPPVEVRCDVHPWMRAYVAVFDHPFHAVTGEGGTFKMTGLPAGTYTVAAWHEKFGTKRTTVTVPPSGDAPNVTIRFGT